LRTVIFANGELKHPARQGMGMDLRPDDVIIAADGGAHHCMALRVFPTYVIGDLDSLSEDDLKILVAHGAVVLRYPTRKDFTDLELAIQHTLEMKPDEIVIYGALGSRWDQTVANLLLAAAYPEAAIRLSDGEQELFYIYPGEAHRIPGQPGDTVSLIPLGADAEGVTTFGLEYSLNDEALVFGGTRGISNVILEPQPSVRLRQGLLLCVVIHQMEKDRIN
jgi:thiamine pyrophosphokinase